MAIKWINYDKLDASAKLASDTPADLTKVMAGNDGADRVAKYSSKMAAGMAFNYAAKNVDDTILKDLQKLADEAQLAEKFEALYNGEVINTGEKRLVLHHLTRGQLGNKVECEGTDKRAFYVKQQERIAEFANKVHSGEIANEKGEKFTTAVQIGIGGSDLGPRAMYLALETWVKVNGFFKMQASVWVQQVLPDHHGNHLSQEHIMASRFQPLAHLAAQADRRAHHCRSGIQAVRRHIAQAGFLCLIRVPAAPDPAEINSAGHFFVCQVHHKLSRRQDQAMGIALLPDADRDHGRI